MTDRGPTSIRPRWKWLVPVGGSGVGFVAWAVLWQGSDAWPGIFVNVGTGAILAALLVFLEPKFTRRIAASVTQNVVDKVAEDTERRLTIHLDEMTARFGTQVAEQNQDRIRTIDELDRPSFETALAALDSAINVRALDDSTLIVTACTSTKTIQVGFERTEALHDPYAQRSEERQPAIAITVHGIPNYSPRDVLLWQANEPADEMGIRLTHALQSQGVWRSDRDPVDWILALRNLQQGLRVAILHRTGEDYTRWATTEQVREYLAENWIITNAGIESCAPECFLYSKDNFPSIPGVRMYRSLPERRPKLERPPPADWPPTTEWPPKPPEDVSEEIWQGYLYRALEQFQPAGFTRLQDSLGASDQPGLTST